MQKKIPMRICVACREKHPKKELLRVVRTTDSEILIDRTGRKNGRGAYLCGKIECFEKAVKTRALDRALDVHLSEEDHARLRSEFTGEHF